MSDSLQIVHQIVSSPPDHSVSTQWVAVVAAGIGILGGLGGAVITGIFQFQAEKRKLRATLISAERLRWLQDLRARLANLYVRLDFQYSLLSRRLDAHHTQDRARIQQELDALSNEIMGEVNLITLMLNPEQGDQGRLRNALQAAIAFMRIQFNSIVMVTPADHTTYQALKQEAFDSLTKIGIETWDQVKELR